MYVSSCLLPSLTFEGLYCMIILFNSNIWSGIDTYVLWRKKGCCHNEQITPIQIVSVTPQIYSVKLGQFMCVSKINF